MSSRYAVPFAVVLAALLLMLISPQARTVFAVTPQTAPTIANWSNGAANPVARCEAQGAAFDNLVYTIGGYYTTVPSYQGTLECNSFNPATNTWARVADLPKAITHGGVAVTPTHIVLAGGYPLQPDGWQTFACTDVNVYDPKTNTWSSTMYPPLPAARGAGALVYVNNQLHFLSGVNITRVSQITHWVLNLNSTPLQWVASTPLPSGRNHVAGVAVGSKIYLIGGQAGTVDADATDTVFIYDTIAQKWSAGARMLKPRSHHADSTFVLNGQIIVAGGITTGAALLADINGYDPASNHWYTLPSLPAPRHSPIVQPTANKFVCTTGYCTSGFTATTFFASYKDN